MPAFPLDNRGINIPHDRLGSVRILIDTAGNVENYYTYDPFGESFDSETQENVTNPYQFTGQWFDAEINQYYLRARMYDPVISRFTSRDPVSGEFQEPMTLHKYLYCTNDPINKVDLTGLWEEGRNAGGNWYGHSDMGYGIDDFHYEMLDEDYPPTILLFTSLHFLSLDMAQGFMYMAILSMDPTLFGYAGHMGQDYYSHRGKGYNPATHAYVSLRGRLSGDRSKDPDNPYMGGDPKKGLSYEFREADKWTKRMEDIWYLFQDPYKWIGASD